jgi:hypothetical protein
MTRAKIDDLRAQVVALKRERAAVESAPQSAAETRAAINAACAQWAAAGAEQLAPLVRGMAVGQEFATALRVPAQGVVDLGPILAHLLGPQALAKALLKTIDVPDGITPAERVTRLADLDARLETAEREEERLIDALERQGAYVARRGDADPRAVLKVRA